MAPRGVDDSAGAALLATWDHSGRDGRAHPAPGQEREDSAGPPRGGSSAEQPGDAAPAREARGDIAPRPRMQPAGWAAVREAAARDLLAADLRCSLFTSALQSYRRDSALRPFPASYARHDCKDFEALLADASKLPSLKEFLQYSEDKDKWAWDLLSWILSSKVLTIHSAGKSETSLFGEGTYLTSDLSLALIYSPHGHGWQHSLLGPILSCVAVCEVIDHPDVKCQTKKKDSKEIDRSRARIRHSEGGDIPPKYFVVTNNQLLRVKYLLVYSQKQAKRASSHLSWFSSHWFTVMLSLYLLLLLIVSVINSSAFQHFWNRAKR